MPMLLPKPHAGEPILARALSAAQLWGATSRGLCQPELLLHSNKDWKPCLHSRSPKTLFLFQPDQLRATQRAHSCTHAAGCTGQRPETVGSTRLKGTFATALPATKVKNTNQNIFSVHQNTTRAHEDVVLHWLTAVNGLTTWKYTLVLGNTLI